MAFLFQRTDSAKAPPAKSARLGEALSMSAARKTSKEAGARSGRHVEYSPATLGTESDGGCSIASLAGRPSMQRQHRSKSTASGRIGALASAKGRLQCRS